VSDKTGNLIIDTKLIFFPKKDTSI
jgi:hypothetical protein